MVAIWVTVVALAIDPGPVSFKADVAPILVARCLGCHNDQKPAGGLNMKTLALLKKGGKTAGAETIVAGDPESSYLVEVIRVGASPRMPMKQAPLTDGEVATIGRWVEEGAKFDGTSESSTTLASLVDPLRNLPKIVANGPTSDPVTALAYSRDGAVLAAAVGRSVLLFDAEGRAIATLDGHPGPLTAVAITPDGKTLVACGGRAGMYGAVAIWDLGSKSRRHDLRGHSDAILGADLSRDGTTLATASYDRTVNLWNIAAGRETRTLKEHTDAVHCVAFSPDGSRLASAGADRTVKVWDVATGKRVVSLGDSAGEVYSVGFDPSGTTLYAGGVDRSIRAWSLTGQGGTLLKATSAHDAAVLRLTVAADGASIVSTGEDRAVKAWKIPTLDPLANLGLQPDWPQAIALDGPRVRLAVGRHDGSIAVLDSHTGRLIRTLREAPKAVAMVPNPKPQLVRNATLNPPSPRGAVRGAKVRISLSGLGVGQAARVHFDDPGLEPTIVASAKPDPNRLDLDLAIAAAVAPGPHRFTVQTPLGVPPTQAFAVSPHPESAEAEPNDDRAKAKPATFPATLSGTIDRPGDVDTWQFEARSGQTLVFETTARAIGSTLDAVLTLSDANSRPIARAAATPTTPDPVLVAKLPADGTFTLEISDAQFGGDGNHVYRIDAGEIPRIDGVYPLGVARDGGGKLEVSGANLGPKQSMPALQPDTRGHAAGSIRPIPWTLAGIDAKSSRSYVIAEGAQAVESEGNDDPPHAVAIAWPGGASGRIDRDGDVDYFRFEAKRGRRAIVEVYGRRLGSPIDPTVEVLDAAGAPVPRAILRRLNETNVAFRDHPSTTRAIRLTKWDGLAVGDTLLVGRELMRLAALPRNPDDDAVFWGLGNERTNSGQRLAFLETTPEHHPSGQPMVKVEIHPPDAAFPNDAAAPATLYYRNDDGGPGFGKDARVTFDPPRDGTYLIRVEDVRGLGGPDSGYHVVVRPPKPDFDVKLSTENPNVPRGGSAIVRVDLARKDGFEGPVEVVIEGLPSGVSATPARVEPESFTADLLLTADATAPAYSPPTWRASARSIPANSGEEPIRHGLDPGGPLGGRITVTPSPDLKVSASPGKIAIRPGERVEMTLSVERGPAFAGRVPIEVRNLPRGVRVLNIGLNGVLVTETQTSRSIFLYAEPWAQVGERAFYAVGKLEASSFEASSPPIP